MTWSYNPGPTASNRDRVRFLVGDTDVFDQLVTDEEVDLALNMSSLLNIAAAIICESLGTKFARMVDETVGPLSRSLGQRSDKYLARGKALRALPPIIPPADDTEAGPFFFGGIF